MASAKKTLARYLASVMFCENELKPCGVCSQCQQIDGGKHSSVIEIEPENGKAIPIDRIREVISLVSTHSLDGRERVIIIEPMESLTPQAQNCLLKSLEDPSTNVIYFLLSHDTSSLLDTILSRCSIFKLTPWPGDVLQQHLVRLGHPRQDAERAAALSGGNIGEALYMLDEQAEGVQETVLAQMLSVSSVSDVVRCSSALKDQSKNAEQILFHLERYLQQCMLVKAGILSPDILKNSPWAASVKHMSIQEYTDLAEQVVKARKLKMSNVNWQSNLDQLMFKLLEAKDKWYKL